MVLFLVLCGALGADPTPQPQVSFTQGTSGTWNAEWAGVDGRTYFCQWSLDLATWQYAPFMEFGEGVKSRGLASDSQKFFIRLFTVDDPSVTSLDEAMAADFDGDGLSNIYEVTYGHNPYVHTESGGLDPDEDGSTNLTEQAQARDPGKKDNPAVGLGVSVIDN